MNVNKNFADAKCGEYSKKINRTLTAVFIY